MGFDPGQAVLGADARQYLEKVAGVLENRPQINIKLCGVAVDEDQIYEPVDAAEGSEVVADETVLKDLAQQRASVVKEYLVESFAVSASRLAVCLPQLEQGDTGAVPRTDLLI